VDYSSTLSLCRLVHLSLKFVHTEVVGLSTSRAAGHPYSKRKPRTKRKYQKLRVDSFTKNRAPRGTASAGEKVGLGGAIGVQEKGGGERNRTMSLFKTVTPLKTNKPHRNGTKFFRR